MVSLWKVILVCAFILALSTLQLVLHSPSCITSSIQSPDLFMMAAPRIFDTPAIGVLLCAGRADDHVTRVAVVVMGITTNVSIVVSYIISNCRDPVPVWENSDAVRRDERPEELRRCQGNIGNKQEAYQHQRSEGSRPCSNGSSNQ